MTQEFLDSYRSTQWQEKKNKILAQGHSFYAYKIKGI